MLKIRKCSSRHQYDQSILDLFGLLLKAEGYEVILSTRTYEDVSDVEQLRPALIILDFKIGP